MKNPLRTVFDSVEPHFEKGGKLEFFYPLYEAVDTFLFTPGDTTQGRTHIRDALDLKRMMSTVAVALTPCILWCLYNTGYQANLALGAMDLPRLEGWRGDIFGLLGIGYNASSFLSNIVIGALFFVPVFLVANIAGGLCEVLFSLVRKHEINEGFLVTGILYPLTLPPSIPLWQVAVGIIFGVIVAKEVFGGTGKNFVNIALTARAFLYFAYPAQISGDSVWTAVDGYAKATPLGIGAEAGMAGITEQYSWAQTFFGLMPGSLGETSALMALIGAVILIATGIGSWKIMASVVIGVLVTTYGLNWIGSDSNPMFGMPPHWHFAVGGLMFGLVFMATDPVSGTMTDKGKWLYGFLIGFMTVIIRVVNPAFPEGIMLAILFGNVFAPLIDYFVVKMNINRRKARLAVE